MNQTWLCNRIDDLEREVKDQVTEIKRLKGGLERISNSTYRFAWAARRDADKTLSEV